MWWWLDVVDDWFLPFAMTDEHRRRPEQVTEHRRKCLVISSMS